MIDRKRQLPSKSGLTLMELLVVLIILIGIGGLVIGNFSDPTVLGTNSERLTPNEVATLATMQEVIKALVGDGTNASNFYGDNFFIPDQLASLLEQGGLNDYNLATKTGWNGPYLLNSGTRYGTFTETDDSDNFTDLYADDNDPAILDSWGRPLVLQISNESEGEIKAERLVSAGPNRLLETDPTNEVDASRGDDIVKFLFKRDLNL